MKNRIGWLGLSFIIATILSDRLGVSIAYIILACIAEYAAIEGYDLCKKKYKAYLVGPNV